MAKKKSAANAAPDTPQTPAAPPATEEGSQEVEAATEVAPSGETVVGEDHARTAPPRLYVPEAPAPPDQLVAHQLACDALKVFQWACAAMGSQRLAPALKPLLQDLPVQLYETEAWLARIRTRREAAEKEAARRGEQTEEASE